MASWRDVVSQGLNTNLALRSKNPGVENIGLMLKQAIARKDEARKTGVSRENMAIQSTYQNYPALAAEAAGIDIPTGTGAPTEAPGGTDLYEVSYDEKGRPTTKFRSPKSVNAPFLMELYNDYVGDTQKANASVLKREYQVKVEPFRDWVRTNFPQYLDIIGEGATTEDYYADKPADVPIELWEAATPDQRKDLLESRRLISG